MKQRLNLNCLKLFLGLMIFSINTYSQSFNNEKNIFINFLKRQYEQEGYEGIKLIEDYEKNYIISILSLNKKIYPSSSTMFRVAKVKAAQQIGAYISGTQVSSELLIRIVDDDRDSIRVEKMEVIIEQSQSFVREVEFLTSFPKKDTENEVVFIYGKEIKLKKK
ncbi:hypothetical protein [Phocaeicola vulgatus]|jgi:hypothetical protein|uniref:hypothetical protein n=1 Tax=Phocaeicola vulgatus TaxID=821 RepID=UPI0011C15615|nr:hypothetical protein [Phocaeicola vulgatus]